MSWILVLSIIILGCNAQLNVRVVLYPGAPFVYNDPNNITGYSIDIWESVVNVMNNVYGYQIVSSYIFTNSVTDYNFALNNGDIGISGMADTPDQRILFRTSAPYHYSIIRALIPDTPGGTSLDQIWEVFASARFIQFLLLVLLFLIPTANIQWYLERKKNEEEFNSNYFMGIGASIYWAWVTVTTVGYGDKTPKTLWGQISTFFIMIIGIVLINLLTGAISASLTISSLESTPLSLLDLAGEDVVVFKHSYSHYLAHTVNAKLIFVDSLEAGVPFLENGTADFFLHEQAALLSVNGTSKVILSGPSLSNVQYTISYPQNSTLSNNFFNDLNFAIVAFKLSSNYTNLVNQYFIEASTVPTESTKDYRDWIPVFVFLGVIVVYGAAIITGYFVMSRRLGTKLNLNPTKEEIERELEDVHIKASSFEDGEKEKGKQIQGK